MAKQLVEAAAAAGANAEIPTFNATDLTTETAPKVLSTGNDGDGCQREMLKQLQLSPSVMESWQLTAEAAASTFFQQLGRPELALLVEL